MKILRNCHCGYVAQQTENFSAVKYLLKQFPAICISQNVRKPHVPDGASVRSHFVLYCKCPRYCGWMPFGLDSGVIFPSASQYFQSTCPLDSISSSIFSSGIISSFPMSNRNFQGRAILRLHVNILSDKLLIGISQ